MAAPCVREEFPRAKMAREHFFEPKRSHAEIMEMRFEQLPDIDKYIYQQGPVILAVNSSFCGLISNSYFRRILNITQARISSTFPMAVIPFTSTMAIYHVAIKEPLMNGDLNCSLCAFTRGGLTGAVVGCLYPIFIALPLNAGLASRYNTALFPSKENTLKYWKGICSPVLKKMRFPILLQFILGGYLGSEHHSVYLKMLMMPAFKKDPEDLSD